MKIFENLPLDKEDQDFLDNPKASKFAHMDHEDLKDHIGFLPNFN